jgi:hypothetical protein
MNKQWIRGGAKHRSSALRFSHGNGYEQPGGVG